MVAPLMLPEGFLCQWALLTQGPLKGPLCLIGRLTLSSEADSHGPKVGELGECREVGGGSLGKEQDGVGLGTVVSPLVHHQG